MSKKVLVAMSGGVDSSVAALLLKSYGYDVTGITMNFGVKNNRQSLKCCAPSAVFDARRVCDLLGIHHFVFDYADEMEKKVIARFVNEYSKGKTPNPCIDCNRYLKFGSLFQKAKSMGFDFLATGHYAAIERNSSDFLLKRPKDKSKDQTYFLYPILRENLNSILFPLAALSKEEVRKHAKNNDLPVAEKHESQDICFITRKGCQAFLEERVKDIKTGPIMDTDGNILGMHRGIVFYTIGQRSGLRISHKVPLYVVTIDPLKNLIIVGEKEKLMARGLIAGNINSLSDYWPKCVYAKIRYRKRESLCEVIFEEERVKAIFREEQEAITPGQSVVFYTDDQVLGGGEIEEVLRD